MNRCNRYSILLVGLTIALTGLVAACTEEPEADIEMGNIAPDFTLQAIDGESLSLSDFLGKKIILNVWVVGCKGCVDEMPHFQEVFDKWSHDELAIVAINIDTAESTEAVKEFVNSQGLTFPVLLDPNGQVSEDYGRFGAPTTFFIDGKGILKEIEHGAFRSPDEIENILDSL